jgi:hypothetical protein
MQGINIARILSESLIQSFSNNSIVYFFDGTIPTNVADISFDYRNASALRDNCVGMKTGMAKGTFQSSPGSVLIPFPQLAQSDFPEIGVTSFVAPSKIAINIPINPSVYPNFTNYWTQFSHLTINERLKNLAEYDFYRVGRGGVSLYNDIPELVNSIGEPLSITGYAFKQRLTSWTNGTHRGSTRATSVSLEAYDKDTDTYETGEVVGSNTDIVINEAAVSIDPSTVGGKEFRVRVRGGANHNGGHSAGRTGDPSWSITSLVLLTDQDPHVSPLDPAFRQITWALVLPILNNQSLSVTDISSTSDYLGTGDVSLPIVICDVGLEGSGAGIEVKKTDTSLYVSPEIVKLNLEFRD